MKDVQYGGQAVIEGVMMRGKDKYAIAVRKPDDEIIVEERDFTSPGEKLFFLGWPFVRGIVALISSLVIGMKALSFSADVALEEEEEEISSLEMVVTILISFGFAILFFVALPAGIIRLIQYFFAHDSMVYNLFLNLLEGVIKIGAFLAYVYFISRIEDIKDVFRYHGAEHKVIYNYEAGEPLSVDNARGHTTLHPRCGTSFIFIVIMISILFFSLLSLFGRPPFLQRVLFHLMLLPLVAGTSYELLKLAGKKEVNPLVRVLSIPGMWFQKLTTGEPDDSMLEVAIVALKAVLPQEGEETGSAAGEDEVSQESNVEQSRKPQPEKPEENQKGEDKNV
ncbi:MAG: DUF1385 domain-containing protein [Bacillota bacterium]